MQKKRNKCKEKRNKNRNNKNFLHMTIMCPRLMEWNILFISDPDVREMLIIAPVMTIELSPHFSFEVPPGFHVLSSETLCSHIKATIGFLFYLLQSSLSTFPPQTEKLVSNGAGGQAGEMNK